MTKEIDIFSNLRELRDERTASDIGVTADNEVAVINKIAEKNGFTKRESVVKKRLYTDQFNVRCRAGVNDLIDDMVYVMKVRKQQLLESAILALLEREGLTPLIKKYKTIIAR